MKKTKRVTVTLGAIVQHLYKTFGVRAYDFLREIRLDKEPKLDKWKLCGGYTSRSIALGRYVIDSFTFKREDNARVNVIFMQIAAKNVAERFVLEKLPNVYKFLKTRKDGYWYNFNINTSGEVETSDFNR